MNIHKKRYSPKEGVELFNLPLVELGALAQERRFEKNAEKVVTFVRDTNPNYSNVCSVRCLFCAFSRSPGEPGAYTLTVEEVLEKIAPAVENGVTTILLQGGHHPELKIDYYLRIVSEIKRRFPTVMPHCFSAGEIDTMARLSGLTVKETLQALYAAGQRTLPGGGAEILTDRIRKQISPKKISTARWFEIHRLAHQLGFKSTATMMYGHIETLEDIIEHLENLRKLQDETGGFTAFIPWSYKTKNTPLERLIKRPAGAVTYLRIIAISRIYLDNFDHIQASWFSEGKRIGQIALHFGADDFGGTLFEENVHKAAGFENRATVEEVHTLIKETGFTPVERDVFYNRLQTGLKISEG